MTQVLQQGSSDNVHDMAHVFLDEFHA